MTLWPFSSPKLKCSHAYFSTSIFPALVKYNSQAFISPQKHKYVTPKLSNLN